MMSFTLGGGGRAECTMYGQENVRNRTQVKLFATSLECKQAGRGISFNQENKGKELRYVNFDYLHDKSFSH